MKKLSLEGNFTTVNRDIEMICMEAAVLSNMVSTIKNIFPNFLQKMTTSFAQVESIPQVVIKLPQLQQFVVQHIDEKQYLDLAELVISVPEGFIGSFAEYSNILSEIASTHLTIVDTVLKPFITYLSHFISNKDAKLSTTDTTAKYVAAQNIRKNNVESITHFRTNGSVAYAKLGSVFSRKPDIIAAYQSTAKLTQDLAKTNLKVVQDHVKNCVELLNIIVDQIESGKITNVTPEVTKNLAFSTLQIAEEIEFMSLVHFKALGFVASIDSMTVTISDYIKEIH